MSDLTISMIQLKINQHYAFQTIYLTLCLFLLGHEMVWTQAIDSTELATYRLEYQQRIKKSRINKVYIPKDLEDAFIELTQKSDKQSLNAFKNEEEVEVCRKLHFGLGKWIMVNWGLERGSRFGHYLKGFGLTFPDDMVQFTMRAFHKKLNNEKIDEMALAKEFIDKRKKEQEERMKKQKVTIVKRKRTPEQ